MQQIEINSVVYNIIVADAYFFIIQNSVTSFYDLILHEDADAEEIARDDCYQHGVFTWNMKDTYLTYEEVNAKYREMKLK